MDGLLSLTPPLPALGCRWLPEDGGHQQLGLQPADPAQSPGRLLLCLAPRPRVPDPRQCLGGSVPARIPTLLQLFGHAAESQFHADSNVGPHNPPGLFRNPTWPHPILDRIGPGSRAGHVNQVLLGRHVTRDSSLSADLSSRTRIFKDARAIPVSGGFLRPFGLAPVVRLHPPGRYCDAHWRLPGADRSESPLAKYSFSARATALP